MVADTFSATLGVLFMGTGNDNTTWGSNCNNEVFQILEDAIANVFVSSATGGTLDLSTPAPPNGPSQARFWSMGFNGSLASNLTVKVPNVTKEWLINNFCTLNGFILQMQTPLGSPVTLPSGWSRVWCDGNNRINIWPQGNLQELMPASSAAAPSYSSSLETTSGFYRHGAQDWRIAINGTDVIQFTSSGFGLVGAIGGAAPTGAEISFAGFFPPTGWYWEDGGAYGRTTDAPLFNAITISTTGNTHGNTTIDNLPFYPVNLGLEGSYVEGTGIAFGTYVTGTSWNGSTGAVTLSGSVSGTNSNTPIRFLPWGQGDGSTTFNVPDRRGRTLFGRDNMNYTPAGRLNFATTGGIYGLNLNSAGGEQAHTLGYAEMPVHNHSAADSGHGHGDSGHGHGVNDPGHVHESTGSGFVILGSGSVIGAGGISVTSSGNTAVAVTGISIQTGFANITTGFANVSIGNAGGGVAHNNIPPGGVTNYIIKR